MNAWLLFRTAQLKVLQRENPDGLRESQGELSKLIAEMWKNCDHEVRNPGRSVRGGVSLLTRQPNRFVKATRTSPEGAKRSSDSRIQVRILPAPLTS